MTRILGKLGTGVGYAIVVVLVLASAVGLIMDEIVVFNGLAGLGAAIALVIFPATLIGAPLYAGLHDGNWLPAIFSWVPAAIFAIINMIGGGDD